MGFEPSMFFQDPRQLPPPPPKAPAVQDELMKAQAQAMLMDGQSKLARAENEKAKIALDAKRMELEAQYKQAENFMKAEMERLKAMIHQHKTEVDVTGKVVDMQRAKDAETWKQQLEAMQLRLEASNAEKDRALEYFKVLATQQGKPDSPDAMTSQQEGEARQAAERQEFEANEAARQAIEAQRVMESQMRDSVIHAIWQEIQAGKAPKEIEYDDNGLMRAMGGKPITRDNDGRVTRIG